MIDKIIAKAFMDAMRSSMKELGDDKDEEHHFDINSKKCKTCKSFHFCNRFAGITNKINTADIDERIREDLSKVILFFKNECIILEEDIKIDDFKLKNLIERFYPLKGCKNLPVLISILDEAELRFLRNNIFKINHKIEKEMNRIIEANHVETKYFMNILRKPKVEEKHYEDMSKEELIEALKKK